MTELSIDPRAKLTDNEAAEKLEAKRRKLFDSPYRPAHPRMAEYWPEPPGEHFFALPLLRRVK